jgi:outer membrane protein TolC
MTMMDRTCPQPTDSCRCLSGWRQPCPRAGKPRRGAAQVKALVIVCLVAAALVIFGQTFPAGAVEKAPAVEAPPPAESLDFDACNRLAIRQSPYFTKSAIEIDLKRIDEADSRYGFIPSVMFRTIYYVDRPTQTNANPQPYSISFASEGYNPFEAFFTLQVRKLVTTLAIYGHLQVIDTGLQRIGNMFLQMYTLKQVAAIQEELAAVARQNLNYVEKRQKIGTGTPLDVKVAVQEMELAQGEKERINIAQKKTLETMKMFMGLKPGQEITLDLRDAERQVFGKFDPATVTMEQTKAKNHDLKIQDIKRQLQEYNIILAKTKLLPLFIFGVQTPDPLSMTTARGLYFWIGLEVPVWDGFKRLRNVSRQKALLRQYDAETGAKELDVSNKFLQFSEEVRTTATAHKVAQAQEELAHLKERQGEIRYQSGGEPLTVFLEARKAYLEAKKTTLLKALDYDLAVLGMRIYTGDLTYSYVQVSNWQK